jgi:hypothetical protein
MTTPSKEDMDKGPMAGAYRSIPLGRPGREEEIAGVMIMLGSAAGGYCNASVIVVDGGRLIVGSRLSFRSGLLRGPGWSFAQLLEQTLLTFLIWLPCFASIL